MVTIWGIREENKPHFVARDVVRKSVGICVDPVPRPSLILGSLALRLVDGLEVVGDPLIDSEKHRRPWSFEI